MSYRVTYPYIEMDVVDVNAKNNISDIIATENVEVSDSNLLKQDNNISEYNYMSLEQNYSILDGSLLELPSDEKISFYSSTVSSDDCSFNELSIPEIIIEFNDYITSYGITINFAGNNLPKKMNVSFISDNNKVVFFDDYYPDEFKFFCSTNNQSVTYKKLKISFIETVFPNNAIKISNIDFGAKYSWKKEDLISADLFEETDILSINLATDTLNFTVTSEDDDFNILNQTGVYYALQKNQIVRAYEIIETYEDGTTDLISSETIFLGNYYSREWKSGSKKEITFKCIDLIGVLQDTKFDEGVFYTPDKNKLKDVIDEIMKVANVTNYTVSDDIKDIGVYGFLPTMSCREALHQVIFFIGAVASCSRSNNLNIYLPSKNIKSTITDENHFDDDVVKLNPYVSKINVSENELEVNDGEQEIYKGYLDVGNHKITTSNLIYVSESSPYISNIGTPGAGVGNIDDELFGLQYFVIKVTKAGDFVVKAKTQTIKSINVITKENTYQKNVLGKTISIDKNYFLSRNKNVNIDYATPTIDRMLNYYNKRNECNCSFLLNDEVTGDWIYIRNQYGDMTKANILNMKIDLSGGFIASARLVCYENIEDLYYRYYASRDNKEIYTGETVGII